MICECYGVTTGPLLKHVHCHITHNFLLPLICDCLPIVDEICHRSLNFVRRCISHPSAIIRFVALYGIMLSVPLSVARILCFLLGDMSACTWRFHMMLRIALLAIPLETPKQIVRRRPFLENFYRSEIRN